MKNDNQIAIKNARDDFADKAAINTDILVIPHFAQSNMDRLSQQPRRKRRINYVKKIQNDSFLMKV